MGVATGTVAANVTMKWLRPLRRAVRVPWRRKALLLRALPLLWKVRLGLWFSSLATLQKQVERWGRGRYSAPLDLAKCQTESDSIAAEMDIDHVMTWRENHWALSRGALLVPAATCLTQALSMQVLLGRAGYPSRLYLGVTKNAQGGFEAHAWVECAGCIVIGGDSPEAWTPLTAWDFTPRRG